MHFGVVVALVAEYINDFTYRTFQIWFPFLQFYHRYLSGFSSFQFVFRDKNIVVDNAVADNEKSIIVRHIQFTHKGILSTFYYFHHFTFGFLTFALCIQAGFHHIVAHGGIGLLFRNENHFATIFGNKVSLHSVAVYRSGDISASGINPEFSA